MVKLTTKGSWWMRGNTESSHLATVCEEANQVLIEIGALVRATPDDYIRFLNVRNKSCTHFYDYNMPQNFFVATRDVEIFPVCGSGSIRVIAPRGTNVTEKVVEERVTDYNTSGNMGSQNQIYSMDNPNSGYGICPSFDNAKWLEHEAKTLHGSYEVESLLKNDPQAMTYLDNLKY